MGVHCAFNFVLMVTIKSRVYVCVCVCVCVCVMVYPSGKGSANPSVFPNVPLRLFGSVKPTRVGTPGLQGESLNLG